MTFKWLLSFGICFIKQLSYKINNKVPCGGLLLVGKTRLSDIIWLTECNLIRIKEYEKTKRFKVQGSQLVQKSPQKTWNGFSDTVQGTSVDSLKQREGKYFG